MSMFSTFGNILGRPLSWFTQGRDDTSRTSRASMEGHDPESDAVESESPDVEPHEPSVLDVLVVRAMLNKACSLPPELLDTILDQAEYWPHSTTEWTGGPLTIYGGRTDRENVFLLRSRPLGFTRTPDDPSLPLDYETTPAPPLMLNRPHSLETFQQAVSAPQPILEHPCRKIVFSIRSHDQGWGGDARHHGTYEGSWTWFDAGLEKFEADGGERRLQEADESEEPIGASNTPMFSLTKLRSIWPEVVALPEAASFAFRHDLNAHEEHKIQANVCARRTFTDHRVEWSWTDDIEPDGTDARLEQLVKTGRGAGTGNGGFVRGLTLGDVVTVWGRARYPAWVNSVDRVRIDVYWAV